MVGVKFSMLKAKRLVEGKILWVQVTVKSLTILQIRSECACISQVGRTILVVDGHAKILRRGTRGSYQKWADTVEDQSFTFDRLLPYFKKSPKYTPSNDLTGRSGLNSSTDAAFFSPTGGPLHVSYSRYRQPFTPFVQSAMSKIGLKSIGGFNGGTLLGYARYSTTIDPKTEKRSSSETSFLQAAVTEQEPVVVYSHTSAQKILFGRNRTATSVLVYTGSEGYILTARKEVIVAAGVVRGPWIMQHSIK